MAKGVRKEKSIRLNEELERVNSALEKSMETVKELQAKKKNLEQDISACAKEALLEVIEQSGLSADELKKAIDSYSGQVKAENLTDNEQDIA